jgi:TetR/AcrR family transcriptional repressor of nem operon
MLPRLNRMTAAQDALAALNDYMDEVVAECIDKTGSPGCFLTNSLLEITRINDGITDFLKGYLAQIENAFAQTIRHAQKSGQVPAGKNADEYAHFMMAAIFSMRSLAKLNAPHEFIRHTRDCTMRALVS